MKKIKLKPLNIVFILLTIAVMVIIYRFSCEDSNDSSHRSGEFVKVILRFFYRDFDSMPYSRQYEIRSALSHFVRKTAHFTVYTALGFCASLSFSRGRLLGVKGGIVLLFCALYAVSDEIHQYYVPGRACMAKDVVIDSCGAVFGILISAAVITAGRRMKKNKMKEI